MANVIMQTSNLSTALRDIHSALLQQAARQNLIMNQAIEIWDEPGTQHGETVYHAELVGFTKLRDYRMPLKLKLQMALTRVPGLGKLLTARSRS